MKIALIISSLSLGGAEKNLVGLANYFRGKGEDVTICILDNYTANQKSYDIHSGININSLDSLEDSKNILAAIKNNFRRIYAIRKFLKYYHPEMVVSFIHETNVLVLISSMGLNIPVLVSERVDPIHPVKYVWNLLRKCTYFMARGIVVQTKSVKYTYPAILRKRIFIINNYVSVQNNLSKSKEKNLLIAMGRLEKQKGFDLLIEAFIMLHLKHPEWRLRIWGEGSERKSLESMIDQNNLKDHISLPGKTNQAFDELSRGTIFILSSRYEGFPNVLLEAMVCGLPVISFDCPSGPNEIIKNKINGLLIDYDDVKGMMRGIVQLIEDEALRKKLANNGRRSCDKYKPDNIFKEWYTLVESLAIH